MPTTTSRVASTSPAPTMVSLVTIPHTPPPGAAASFVTDIVDAAADILVPPVTVTPLATAGFMAGGIVGREIAEAQAGLLSGGLGEMAGQTVGATAGTVVGSALVGCAKRSTSAPSRPINAVSCADQTVGHGPLIRCSSGRERVQGTISWGELYDAEVFDDTVDM